MAKEGENRDILIAINQTEKQKFKSNQIYNYDGEKQIQRKLKPPNTEENKKEPETQNLDGDEAQDKLPQRKDIDKETDSSMPETLGLHNEYQDLSL